MRATLARLLRVNKRCHEIVRGCAILWDRIHFGASDGELGVTQMKVFIERSKGAYIDVQFACFVEVDQPTRRAATVMACALLRENIYRVRSLLFAGKVADLFPISHSLPALVCLYVVPFDVISPNDASQISHLILDAPNLRTFNYRPVTLRHAVEDPFKGINSQHLRNLTLNTDDPKFVEFISTCSQLRRLSVTCTRLWPGTPRLPFLHDLDALGPLDGLGPLLATVPPLVHLSVRDFSIVRDIVNYIAEDGRSLWPPLPHLRTLTLTHRHFSDVISVLKTSPHIVALDLSSSEGFVAFLHALIARATATPSGDTEHPSNGDPTLVPGLTLLRTTFKRYLAAGSVEPDNDASVIVPLVRKLMVTRPNLTVQIRVPRSIDSTALKPLSEEFPRKLQIRRLSSRSTYEAEDTMRLAHLYPCNEVMHDLDENVAQTESIADNVTTPLPPKK